MFSDTWPATLDADEQRGQSQQHADWYSGRDPSGSDLQPVQHAESQSQMQPLLDPSLFQTFAGHSSPSEPMLHGSLAGSQHTHWQALQNHQPNERPQHNSGAINQSMSLAYGDRDRQIYNSSGDFLSNTSQASMFNGQPASDNLSHADFRTYGEEGVAGLDLAQQAKFWKPSETTSSLAGTGGGFSTYSDMLTFAGDDSATLHPSRPNSHAQQSTASQAGGFSMSEADPLAWLRPGDDAQARVSPQAGSASQLEQSQGPHEQRPAPEQGMANWQRKASHLRLASQPHHLQIGKMPADGTLVSPALHNEPFRPMGHDSSVEVNFESHALAHSAGYGASHQTSIAHDSSFVSSPAQLGPSNNFTDAMQSYRAPSSASSNFFSASEGSSQGSAIADRSRRSSGDASHFGSMASQQGVLSSALPEFMPSAPSSSRIETLNSSLAQAFAPVSSRPSTSSLNSVASFSSTSSNAASTSPYTEPPTRQRASTLSAPSGEARAKSPYGRPVPAFQRSNSSDGAVQANFNDLSVPHKEESGQRSSLDAARLDAHSHFHHHHRHGQAHSHSDMTRTPSGSSTASQHHPGGLTRAAQGSDAELEEGSLQQQNVAMTSYRRDSDPSRLTMAMANAQLVPSSRDSHSATPTIMEEDEDNFSIRQPHQAATENLGLFGGGKLGAHSQEYPSGNTSSNHLDAEQFLFLQQNQQHEQPSVAEAAYPDIPQAQLQQLQPPSLSMPPHQPFGGTTDPTPTVLQRRYRPPIRPTTYQQATIMNYDEEGDSGLHGLSEGESGNPDAFIDDMIRQYITSPSRLGLGERTVMIMTSKVAQKSYGAEKRFLCPPPMVLLIGSSWWSVCQDSGVLGLHPGQNSAELPTILTPPRVNIAMTGESSKQDGSLEWATNSGRLIEVGNPSSEMAVSGRCIGKQLFITGMDEKNRACETLVSVSVPGLSATDSRLLGTFPSKPIKIISKPSKKRQSSRHTDLGITHGSIISLFHRLRSQTVSTRYLCVSGAPTWFKGSDGQPFLTIDQLNPQPSKVEPPSCFVAKMTSWDPFIVYLVDPKKKSNDPNAAPLKPPLPNYPAPPPVAMELLPNGHPTTIHYNQRIVLQCLNTAVVSPIMVIRKVEKATSVVGGVASAPSANSISSAGEGPSQEALGDPVSQLHKIALEVVEDPHAPAPSASMTDAGEPASPGPSGPFLACLNESVGMRRPLDARKWVWNHFSSVSTPTTPMTPATAFHESGKGLGGGHPASPVPPSPTAFAAAYAAAQTKSSLAHSRSSLGSGGRPPSSSSSAGGNPYPIQAQQPQGLSSCDGGKVRRPRRVSSSVVTQRDRLGSAGSVGGAGGSNLGPAGNAIAAAKGRRRGQSLSMVEWQKEQARQLPPGSLAPGMASGYIGGDLSHVGTSYSASASESSVGGAPLGASWTVDIADSDVWTIVGTDIARHTFYVPPRVIGGVRPTASIAPSGISHLITTPAPSKPIAPIPMLHSFIPPPPSDTPVDQKQRHVTLIGENLNEDLLVYFGDWRSTTVKVASPDTMLCTPPPPAAEAFQVPSIRLPIILVRKDGVIFPSDCIYSS